MAQYPCGTYRVFRMDFLDGLVERITYYNAENGYTVLRLNARLS